MISYSAPRTTWPESSARAGVAPMPDRCFIRYTGRQRQRPASAICRYWSSTGSTRSDSHWAAEFRRQRTYRLEQSATSTIRSPDLSQNTFKQALKTHLFSSVQ